MTEIEKNVKEIRKKIAAAAGGREICLVAATKQNGTDRVKAAIAAGVDACGENRVQELVQKLSEGAYEGAALHFIGRLQKNKVSKLVGTVSLIESVDSEELMAFISAKAAEKGVLQDILLQVNIGGEESKGGFSPQMLEKAVEAAGKNRGIRVRGLMTIPPISTSKGGNRRYFDQMKELFVDIRAKEYDNVSMDFLSMGMSEDFEDAIAAGANMIRVGSAIFGARK